ADLTLDERLVLATLVDVDAEDHNEASFWGDVERATSMPSDRLTSVVKGLMDSNRVALRDQASTTVRVIDPPLPA
ncbi:MAG: hypothetical protein ABJZ55_13505, partial [Fuerstiella sp.]